MVGKLLNKSKTLSGLDKFNKSKIHNAELRS